MTNTIASTNKIQFILSSIVIAVGILLLIFMVTVESEPGAIPLALIVTGVSWNFVIRRKSKSKIGN